MIIRKHFLIPLFLLCFAFANSQSYASEKAVFSLTPEEKAWLAEHPEISMGIMDAWVPMNFMDESGTPNGIGVDYLKALNQRLGGVLTIEAGPFKENYSRVKNKKLDALMDITPKKEREPFFNFTKPYLTIPHVIVGRKDGLYFDSEKDLANKTIALEGKRVAVVKGYAIHEWLRDAVEVGDLTALSEMASELKARADAASAYGEKIGRLTDGFDFDGLLNLAVTLYKEQSAGLAGVMGTHKTAS